jgi:hypothetical protein
MRPLGKNVEVMLRPTVRRPVCLGVKAPKRLPRLDFCYCQTAAGLLIWGALSDERRNLSFTIATGPRQRSHSQVRFPCDLWSYITVSNSRLLQPGRPGPRIYIPQEQGSVFVAFYDSQDNGGGIRPRLHTGEIKYCLTQIRLTLSSYLTGNTLRLRYKTQPVNAV